MLRTIERHVLQEVSQTTLTVVLVDGTYTLSNVEVSHMLRVLVMTNVISKSVIQFTDTNVRINGNWRHLHLLCHHCCRTEYHQCSHKKFSKSHRI